jgi:cytochrome subunit of sulfide dehydrogenase
MNRNNAAVTLGGTMNRLRINLVLILCCQWSLPLLAEESFSQATTTLAASCAACHGPQGNSLGGTPTLAALNNDYFIQRMQGFRSGAIPATVMHQHAKGLTDEEIIALAAYFAAQPRGMPLVAPQQSFKGAQ